MWLTILQIIVIGDLLINFFFHLVQLRKYCATQHALHHLGDRFNTVESKFMELEHSTRLLHRTLTDPIQTSRHQHPQGSLELSSSDEEEKKTN